MRGKLHCFGKVLTDNKGEADRALWNDQKVDFAMHGRSGGRSLNGCSCERGADGGFADTCRTMAFVPAVAAAGLEDLVIAPSAGALALMVAPEVACRNLERLAADGQQRPYGL